MLTLPGLTDATPDSMAYLDGRLYIADTAKNRILVGDAAKPAFTESIPADAPASIQADPARKLLWFVSNQKAVIAIAPDGKQAAAFTKLEQPLAVAVAGDRMAVASARTGRIHIYSIADPQNPAEQKSIGTGDGPFGPFDSQRFRFQSYAGKTWFHCVLALSPDGTLAVHDRWLSVLGANGGLQHASFSQFGNASRRVQGTDPKTFRFFDQAGKLSWHVDPDAGSWKPDALWYVPEFLTSNIGFFMAGGELFGVYDYDRPIGEKQKDTGLAIVRFDKQIGRTVSLCKRDAAANAYVVAHDANADGIIDDKDGGGAPLDRQPPFWWADARWRYVQPDGSPRMMGTFGTSLGLIWKLTGLDDRKRPVYALSPANAIPTKVKAYGSPYQPDKQSPLRTHSESALLGGPGGPHDGGVLVRVLDGADPSGMGFSNSGGCDLCRFDKTGELLWFCPLNDYGPIQGVKPLGNFILTSWGHQGEWIGLDPDGLMLGRAGWPRDADWGGYWIDHPDHYTAFETGNGKINIMAGDYVRNGQHRLVLSNAHDYVKNSFPVKLGEQPFTAAGQAKAGWQILPRANQPRVTIPKLAAPLTIDGTLDKWRAAGIVPQVVIQPNNGKGIKGPRGTCAVVRLAYESTNLYVSVIRFDDVITMHQPWAKSYLQDTVEMMINGFMKGFQRRRRGS